MIGNILAWLPRVLWAATLTVYDWAEQQIEDVVNSLLVYLFTVAGVSAIGIGLCKIGLVSIGTFMIALAGCVSGFLWLYIWIRVATLAVTANLGNTVISAFVREISRPLPSTPIEIPIIVSEQNAASFLRAVMAGFAGLTGASLYAMIFPVYENLTGYMVAMTAVFFIVFATYGFATQNSSKVIKWLIYVAAAVVVVYSFSLVAPQWVTNEYHNQTGRVAQDQTHRQEMEEAARQTQLERDSRLVGIQVLVRQRQAITSKLASGQPLSEEDQQQLTEINQRIEALASGTAAQPQSADPRQFNGNVPKWPIGIALLVGLWWLMFGKFWRTSNSSPSGGH